MLRIIMGVPCCVAIAMGNVLNILLIFNILVLIRSLTYIVNGEGSMNVFSRQQYHYLNIMNYL